MRYIWYRFKTFKEEPLKDIKLINMPYWISGDLVDNRTLNIVGSVIVCYLPAGVNLSEYWSDAFDIDTQERNEITYTDRFPKPYYIK